MFNSPEAPWVYWVPCFQTHGMRRACISLYLARPRFSALVTTRFVADLLALFAHDGRIVPQGLFSHIGATSLIIDLT